MKTLTESDSHALIECAECLAGNGVAIVPTETVYGLMTRWDNDAGRERIYALKHRPAAKRLQMLAASYEDAIKYGVGDSPQLRRLAQAFWPGALTVVAPNRDRTDSIGLRIPSHPFVLRLLKKCGCALAATSANLSGEPPAIDCGHALAHLDGQPDLAVDGGVITVTGGTASTVVSLLDDTPVILREGVISLPQIAAALA